MSLGWLLFDEQEAFGFTVAAYSWFASVYTCSFTNASESATFRLFGIWSIIPGGSKSRSFLSGIVCDGASRYHVLTSGLWLLLHGTVAKSVGVFLISIRWYCLWQRSCLTPNIFVEGFIFSEHFMSAGLRSWRSSSAPQGHIRICAIRIFHYLVVSRRCVSNSCTTLFKFNFSFFIVFEYYDEFSEVITSRLVDW